MIKSLLVACIGFLIMGSAYAITDTKPMTDNEIRRLIIDGTISQYEIYSCPCPYSRDENAKICGDNSLYIKTTTSSKPKCYEQDIKDYEVENYRSQKGIPRM